MSPAESIIQQVRIDALASFYSGLVAALSEAGFGGSRLNEIFPNLIRAECVGCGIQITGGDMAQIALSEKTTNPPNSKLDRLRQGYCARKGCDSYYYRIHFRDDPNLDWRSIYDKAAALAVVAPAATEEGPAEERPTIRNWLLVRLGVAIAVVFVLLLIWQIRYYGYVPLLQKPHHYTIDPASASGSRR
jgi:hypothetical protein